MKMDLIPTAIAKPSIRKTQLLINGQWRDARDGRTFATIDPATEQVIARVAEAGEADVDLAVRAAHAAVGQCRGVGSTRVMGRRKTHLRHTRL